MEEADRAERYAKSRDTEARLRDMNACLAPSEERLLQDATEPRLPVVLVIGPPCSGTTLMGQVLAHAGCFGYVSNFLARFWMVPATGARIERALGILDDRVPDSFASENGVTCGWAEPHEFGYFWNRWFDLGESTHRLSSGARARVDGDGLRRSLAAMEAAMERPLTFKNNTWCTLQADFLAQTLPTALFVVCRRHPLYVAQSILKSRRLRLQDPAQWWSIRPSTTAEILRYSPLEQVVLQALALEREMDAVLASIAPSRIIDARYVRMCSEPQAIVDDVVAACAGLGCALEIAREAPEGFVNSNAQSVDDADWQALTDTYERFHAQVDWLEALP